MNNMPAAHAVRDAPGACPMCWGSGKIANDEEQSPWPIWDALEGVERMSITLGLVRPVPCPDCQGTGKTAEARAHAPAAPNQEDAALEERLTVLGLRLAALVQVALTIPLADVQLALETEHRKDTIMPIMDPTRYRKERRDIARMQRVLAAFLTFRQVLEEERAKE